MMRKQLYQSEIQSGRCLVRSLRDDRGAARVLVYVGKKTLHAYRVFGSAR